MNKTLEDNNIKVYSDYELTKLFAQFQEGIEWLEALEKRLIRKKVEYEIGTTKTLITHLKTLEKKYYDFLIEIFVSDDEEDKQYYREECTMYIHNKYGIINKMFEWEMKIREEQGK